LAAAQFNQPQGMALGGRTLYVADTENHLIRAVDLDGRKVTTVAGTGRQAREPASPTHHGNPRTTPLSSPWDLLVVSGTGHHARMVGVPSGYPLAGGGTRSVPDTVHGNDLYIAMAGCHQIWKMRLDGTAIGPYAGNGREDIVDGPLLPREPYQEGFASFAQPSGLASDGEWLYVADSEGSSIRAVPFDPRREVRTVVGTAGLGVARLFTFGDVDGPAARVRLQHPLGLAFYAGQLYLADTYNHKIKAVDPASGEVRTIAGTGKPGHSDEPAGFYEPGGLAAAGGKLFVADTDNQLIRVIDLAGRKVSTLAIPGLTPGAHGLTPGAHGLTPGAHGPKSLAAAVEEKLAPQMVRAEAGAVRLKVRLRLPPAYKLNPLAPMAYRLEEVSSSGPQPPGPIRRDGFGWPVRLEKPAEAFEIRLPVAAASGHDAVRVVLDYYYCREGAEGLCKFGTVAWSVPLELSATAPRDVIELRHDVQ
jgi:DNA-binding beta-propeller fold protein YncE